jgi:four helix bundle protein
VCQHIAEAWRQRPYPKYFSGKLTGAAGEADETRVWLEFAWRCNYISEDVFRELDEKYDAILGQLIHMASHPEQWAIRKRH